jgi:hypothetical protein
VQLIQGVQAAIEIGVGHVVVETDATSVVQAVYTSSHDFNAMTNLISELRSLLALNFISWKVHQRPPRSCNRAAYELLF